MLSNMTINPDITVRVLTEMEVGANIKKESNVESQNENFETNRTIMKTTSNFKGQKCNVIYFLIFHQKNKNKLNQKRIISFMNLKFYYAMIVVTAPMK